MRREDCLRRHLSDDFSRQEWHEGRRGGVGKRRRVVRRHEGGAGGLLQAGICSGCGWICRRCQRHLIHIAGGLVCAGGVCGCSQRDHQRLPPVGCRWLQRREGERNPQQQVDQQARVARSAGGAGHRPFDPGGGAGGLGRWSGLRCMGHRGVLCEDRGHRPPFPDVIRWMAGESGRLGLRKSSGSARAGGARMAPAKPIDRPQVAIRRIQPRRSAGHRGAGGGNTLPE